MKAVVMAAGFGCRLHPLMDSMPNPMVAMANRPMIEHIIGLLRANGLEYFVTFLCFQPQSIERDFWDGREFGVKMTGVTATEDYGAAGAVKHAGSIAPSRAASHTARSRGILAGCMKEAGSEALA